MYYAIVKTKKGLEFHVGRKVEDMALSMRLTVPEEVDGTTVERIYKKVDHWQDEIYTYKMKPAPIWKQVEISKSQD